MDEKNKFWKGVMTGVLVTAFACLVTVGTSLGIYMFGRRAIDNQVQIQAEQGSPSKGTKEPGTEDEGKAKTLDLNRVNEKLKQIENIVNQVYLFEEKADADKEEAGIYKGYLYGLNDPYAVYYTKEELAAFMEDTTGTYCGIGASVSQNVRTGISTVIRVYKDTPAEKAGLLPGDILFSVSGTEVTGMDLDLVVKNYIRGEENTDVKITVFRENTNEYKELTLTRKMLDVQTVETEMLENHIGYISVSQFDKVTAGQFQSGIEELAAHGMKKLIIDLRNNPGGELETVSTMMDYVLPDGKTMVTISDKYGKEEVKTSGDGHQMDIPIAVLVNGNSASASEVFTGALKDYKKASIVGTNTFGKGIVQSVIPLSDGSAIKLTMAHYYTPNGTDIHEKGIAPDVNVELDEEAATMVVVPKEKDNQLQAAVKLLNEK